MWVAGNRTDGKFAGRTEGGIGPSVRLGVGGGGITVHIREVRGFESLLAHRIIFPTAVGRIYSGQTAVGVSETGIIIGRGFSANRTDGGG